MGRKCVILKCKSGLNTNKEKISMFSIPKNKLEIWQKALPVKNRQLTHRDAVCEKHFRKSDIIREVKTPIYTYTLNIPKLHPNAIPCIFPPNGNYQLRPRISNRNLPQFRKIPGTVPKPKLSQLTAKKKQTHRRVSETWKEPTDIEKQGTTSEEAFKIKLQQDRQNFSSHKCLTEEKYNALASEIFAQKKIPKFSQKYDVIEINGVLKLKTPVKNKLLLYAHDDELFEILRYYHIKLKHAGRLKMMTELKKRYVNIQLRDVITYLSLCITCLRKQRHRKKVTTEPMIYSDMSSRCSINLIDYQECPSGGYQFVMVYQNCKTKFCILKPIKSEMSLEIVNNLVDIFCIMGVSTEIESEKKGIFLEEAVVKLRLLWPSLSIKHVKTIDVSEEIKVIDTEIKNWMEETKSSEWTKILPMVQFLHNKEFNTSVEAPPFDTLFGFAEESNTIEDKPQSLDKPLNDATEILYSCKICGNYPEEEDLCVGCTNKNIVRRLLPKFYQIWDELNEGNPSEETFKKQLHSMRQKYYNYESFSKEQHDALISEVEQDQLNDTYGVIEIEGIKRLISPILVDTIQYYVHDDELFYILHYTHINLNHAWKTKMSKALKNRFKNIANIDIMTYLLLCPMCKHRREFSKKLGVESAVYSDASAHCSINFIDYQTRIDADFKYVMIYQNHLTKFCMLKPLISLKPEEVAYKLIDIFAFLGMPKTVESEKNKNYVDKIVEQLQQVWKGLEITYVNTTAQVLEDVCAVDEDIKTWMEDNKSLRWSKGLRFVQLERNREFHSEIETAPYDALFGFVSLPEKDLDMESLYYKCKICGMDADQIEICAKCEPRNGILKLLSALYNIQFELKPQIFGTVSEEIFQKKLKENRQTKPSKNSLSKERYFELLGEVTKSKMANNKLEMLQYDETLIDGVQRLTSASGIRNCIYVHDDEIFEILNCLHIQFKHAPLNKMTRELKKHFVNISNTDIKAYVNICPICKKENRILEPVFYNRLSLRCSIDIIDCRLCPDGEYKYVLVYQNPVTKFCMLRPLKYQMPSEIAGHLMDIFTVVGAHKVIESQKGGKFVREVVVQFKFLWPKLKVGYSESIGDSDLLEDLEDIEDQIITWVVQNETGRWTKMLQSIQLACNREFHRSIEKAPCDASFNC